MRLVVRGLGELGRVIEVDLRRRPRRRRAKVPAAAADERAEEHLRRTRGERRVGQVSIMTYDHRVFAKEGRRARGKKKMGIAWAPRRTTDAVERSSSDAISIGRKRCGPSRHLESACIASRQSLSRRSRLTSRHSISSESVRVGHSSFSASVLHASCTASWWLRQIFDVGSGRGEAGDGGGDLPHQSSHSLLVA